jgi:hypothetical protein
VPCGFLVFRGFQGFVYFLGALIPSGPKSLLYPGAEKEKISPQLIPQSKKQTPSQPQRATPKSKYKGNLAI